MADESLNPKDSLTEIDYQSKGLLVTGLLLLSLLLITWLLEALGTDLNAARWAFSPSAGWPLGSNSLGNGFTITEPFPVFF